MKVGVLHANNGSRKANLDVKNLETLLHRNIKGFYESMWPTRYESPGFEKALVAHGQWQRLF